MQLISSWSRYLEYRCADCGETIHVDAALDFPREIACRSGKCRTSAQNPDALADGDHFARMGIPALHWGC